MAVWAARAIQVVARDPRTDIAGVITLEPVRQQRLTRLIGVLGRRGWRRPRFAWTGRRASLRDAPTMLREASADVVLWLDAREPSAELAVVMARSTRLGLWFFRQGDGRLVHDGIGMAEVFDGRLLTQVSLVRTDGEGRATTLRSGVYRTIAGSPLRNRTVVLEGFARWLTPELLAAGQPRPNDARAAGARAEATKLGLDRRTRRRFGELPGSVSRVVLDGVSRHLARLVRHDDWNIGVALGPSYEDVLRGRLPEIAWLPTRRGHFSADPFLLERDGRVHLYFEDYSHATGRGEIAHVELRAGRPVGVAVTALAAAHHLSYPFPVECDDRVYLLPESSAASAAILHEATAFPTGWQPAVTLLSDTRVSDATLVFAHGRWWMFATVNGPREDAELYAWHADALDGAWTSHPLNPVKVDVRSARPAGTPFHWRGDLYRPAQDASVRYGGRLVINRVTELSETTFAEEPVAVLEPDPNGPYPAGCHTLSLIDGIAVVDGYRTTFSWAAFFRLWTSGLRRRVRQPLS